MSLHNWIVKYWNEIVFGLGSELDLYSYWGKITTHPCYRSQEGIGGIEELFRSNIQTIL